MISHTLCLSEHHLSESELQLYHLTNYSLGANYCRKAFPKGGTSINKKVQLDATVCRHLFTAKSLYLFRVSQHTSSGALKTVTATSGIGHNTGTATSFQRGLIKTLLHQVGPFY